MNNSQAAVINSSEAMSIIINEAKKMMASKFSTTIEMIEIAIAVKNDNVLSMMRQLVKVGINEAAAL